MLGSLHFHCYTGSIVEPNIVDWGFWSIQFTVTFPRTWNVDSIVKSIILKSGSQCDKFITSYKIPYLMAPYPYGTDQKTQHKIEINL